MVKFLTKPLSKKTAPKQCFKGVPHEWLRSSIKYWFGWCSIVLRFFWGEKISKTLSTFLWVNFVTCEVLTCPWVSLWFHWEKQLNVSETNWHIYLSLDVLLGWIFQRKPIESNWIDVDWNPYLSLFFGLKSAMKWKQFDMNWNPYLSLDFCLVQKRNWQ